MGEVDRARTETEVGAQEALADRLAERTAVLSAHLDDAVLSLGAAIARATEEGAEVRIVTVLAGDPLSDAAAGSWDRASGFRTAAAAAQARRQEDLRACRIVGALPVWLPFGDLTYGRQASDDEIWAAVVGAVEGVELVLVPGFPLAHPDHAWLAALALARRASLPPCALYEEQPYAYHAGFPAPAEPPPEIRARLPGPLIWQGLRTRSRHRRAKRRAMRAYGSQLRGLSTERSLAWRITSAERRHRGERVAQLPPA